MNVGTRELKNRRSFLRRVREVLAALAAKAEVTSGRGRFKAFTAIKPRGRGSVARLVVEDRE